MDEMGTPGPNHPAHRGLSKNNVVNFPMNKRTRLRHAINKAKDALFEPEQVTYSEPWSEPKAPVEGALDNHIKNAIENSGLDFGRTEHFNAGQQEATIHNINEGRELKRLRGKDE